MRIYPALKKIPEYVSNENRKHSNKEVVNELEQLIEQLKKVSPEDKASAYNYIGIIYSYLNDCESAKNYYYESYLLDADEAVYVNYLIMLQRLNQIPFAFTEACTYLDKHPNNILIFELLMGLVCKFPSSERLRKLKNYRTFQTESEEVVKYRDDRLLDAIKDIDNLNKYQIDQNFYETYLTIALEVCKRFAISTFQLSSTDNVELGQFVICISSSILKYQDIIYLNQEFDREIQKLILSCKLDKIQYFNHLNKLSVFFSVSSTTMEVA